MKRKENIELHKKGKQEKKEADKLKAETKMQAERSKIERKNRMLAFKQVPFWLFWFFIRAL